MAATQHRDLVPRHQQLHVGTKNPIITAAHQIALRLRPLHRQDDRGLRVIGATITPFKGWNSYTEELESVRQAVNAFIRTSQDFDVVVDSTR